MVIVCGYQPPLRYVVRRKCTTNPRTVQVFFWKNSKFLKFIPIFGGERGFFPSPYICNEMEYIGILYIFPLCLAKAMHLHKKLMHLHCFLMHLQ